jgi:MFS family permease
MSFTSSPSLPRSIGLVAVARAVSIVGDEVALIALVFRARATFGHWGVAALLAAGSAPLILVGPVAGLLVDRVATRRFLYAATSLQVALCVTLGFAGRAAFIPLIAGLACATAVVSASWQVLVPALVGDDQLPAALGRIQTTTSLAGVVGPLLGGLAFAALGYRGAVLLDAASFLALLAVPAFVAAKAEPATRPTDAPRDGLFSGVALVRRDPVLRALTVMLSLVVLAFGVVNVVEIFFTVSTLHAGPRGYGLLGLCLGVGMVVGSSLSATLSQRVERPERVVLATCASLAVLLGAFALTRALWQAALVVGLLGAANALLNVEVNVLFVRATASVEHLRGRVFATVTGAVSAAQLGALGLGGALLSLWSPRTIILEGALAAAVVLSLAAAPLWRAGRASSPAPVTAGD